MSMDLTVLIERSGTFQYSPETLRKIVSSELQESGDGYVVTIAYTQQKQSTDNLAAQDKVHILNPTEENILDALQQGAQNSKQLLEILGYKTKTGNFKRAIAHLLEIEYIQMTKLDKPKARDQANMLNGKN